ncbi:MAG: hypothetical protein LC644_04230 [Pseudonocardia sp.]|nr:hypothetical protein [Pseudonocardia sp.]
MSTTVLFDRPGPRTRRRIMVGSIVTGLALGVLVILVLVQLAAGGQLTEEKWGPVVNPANPSFVALWVNLGLALLHNIEAAVLAMVLSMLLGTVLALTSLRSCGPVSPRYPAANPKPQLRSG